MSIICSQCHFPTQPVHYNIPVTIPFHHQLSVSLFQSWEMPSSPPVLHRRRSPWPPSRHPPTMTVWRAQSSPSVAPTPTYWRNPSLSGNIALIENGILQYIIQYCSNYPNTIKIRQYIVQIQQYIIWILQYIIQILQYIIEILQYIIQILQQILQYVIQILQYIII